MPLSAGDKIKIGSAAVLLAAAVWGIGRFLLADSDARGDSYFYDLGAQKLFAGPHEAIPPIRGKFGSEMDGVRAVVVSTTGDCKDKSSLKIVYLETYAPEFKQKLDDQKSAASAGREVENLSRNLVQALRLIRRPDETNWHSINSPEAQAIMEALTQPGSSGAPPTICLP